MGKRLVDDVFTDLQVPFLVEVHQHQLAFPVVIRSGYPVSDDVGAEFGVSIGRRIHPDVLQCAGVFRVGCVLRIDIGVLAVGVKDNLSNFTFVAGLPTHGEYC